MTKKEFLAEIIEVLELEEDELELDTNLDDVEDYDSFAVLSIIAFVHKKFGIQFKANQLQELGSINDLIKLIGEDNFE